MAGAAADLTVFAVPLLTPLDEAAGGRVDVIVVDHIIADPLPSALPGQSNRLEKQTISAHGLAGSGSPSCSAPSPLSSARALFPDRPSRG
jgi:hypothetical protein